MKTVTAIIPTYNRFKYLLNTIKSIKTQTYSNIEIIVINDSSTQKEYYQYDWHSSGVTIIHLGENSRKKFGYPCGGFVRNQGSKIASGEYIAFCDDDDIWLPEKIELQLNAMIKDNTKMSSSDGLIGSGVFDVSKDYKLYNEENYKNTLQNIYKKRGSDKLNNGFPEIWDYDFLKTHNCMITSSVIIEKKVLESINYMNNLRNGREDYDCWLRCLKEINKSSYVKTPCFYYDRGHGDGREY